MAHLEFQCQHCKQRLRMSDEHVGKTIRCPACKETFVAALAASQSEANSASSKNAASQTRSSDRDAGPVPRANRSKPAQKPSPQSSSGSRPAEPRSRATKKPVRRLQQEAAWEEEATWDDDINSWDDAESYSEDYADPYAATPRQRPARKKKSELPGKLLRVGLFAMLALIVLGTFGGLGYLAINHMPMIGNNVVDMSWMPAKVEGFAYFEPAKLAATPFADMIRNKFPQTVSDKLEGVATADIDSILIGFWQEEGPQVELPPTLQIPAFSSIGGLGSTNFLWVTKLNKDLPGALEVEQKSGEYNGVALYSSRGKYSCMPDSRTILIGSERSVKAALDGSGKQFNHSSFRFVKDSGNVVLAAMESPSEKSSKKSTLSSQSFPLGSSFGASQKVGELFKQHARAGYLVINVDTQVSFSAGIVCYDTAGAASVDQELHTALDGGGKQIESLKSIPPLAKLSDPLTTLLNSLNVASEGDTVSITGTVEPSLIDALPSSAE